jgi:glycolate oxidase FAD binding subunit
LTSGGLVPSAVELTWPSRDGPGIVKGLYEGFEPGVQAQSERAFAYLGHPATQGLSAPIMSNAWIEDEEPPSLGGPGASVRVKLTHPPAALPDAIRAAWATGPAPGISGHAATGVLFVDVDASGAGPDPFGAALAGLRAFAARVGGSALVLDAPPDVAASVDVWGPGGDALDLMRRVKARFDPTRTMSPGRFVGGI